MIQLFIACMCLSCIKLRNHTPNFSRLYKFAYTLQFPYSRFYLLCAKCEGFNVLFLTLIQP